MLILLKYNYVPVLLRLYNPSGTYVVPLLPISEEKFVPSATTLVTLDISAYTERHNSAAELSMHTRYAKQNKWAKSNPV